MNLSDAAVHLARAEKAEAECARLGDLANERHAAYEQERIWHNDVSKRLVLMEQRAEKAESELRNRTNELEAESIIGRNFKAMFERAEHELAYMKEETGRLVGILQGMGKSLGTGCGDSIPEHAATVGAELVKLRKLADAGQEVVTCARPWSTHPSGDAKNLRNAIVAWDIIKGGA